MNIGQRNDALKKYLKSKTFDSSSDYILGMYNFDVSTREEESPYMCAAMVEQMLKHVDNHIDNVVQFRDIIVSLPTVAKQELYKSYVSVMDDFCNNHEVYKKYKLDEEDEEGWVIYKQLSSKTNLLNQELQFAKWRNKDGN